MNIFHASYSKPKVWEPTEYMARSLILSDKNRIESGSLSQMPTTSPRSPRNGLFVHLIESILDVLVVKSFCTSYYNYNIGIIITTILVPIGIIVHRKDPSTFIEDELVVKV